MDTQQAILIVDDKSENLFILKKVLNVVDAHIIEAGSGNEALIATLNHEFALAIVDVQMPGMDGYELAEYLRGDERTMNLPLIFLTAAYSDDYHIFKGYEAGAVDFIVKPFNPEVLLGKVNVFLQLDSQKRALMRQIELEKTKNYLESILAAVSDAILVVSLEAVVETVNKAALELLGYRHDIDVGLSVEKLFKDNHIISWISNLRDDSLSGAEGDYSVQKIETELITAAGDKIPVLLSISALLNQVGKVQGVVLAAVDISDRIKAERMLKEYSETLEDRVQERTRELQEAQERLISSERLATLGQLAGSVGHELRNPLGVISNTIYLLNLLQIPNVDGKVDECLNIMTEEIKNAESIITDLLDYGRKKTANPVLCSINEIVEKSLTKFPPPEAIDLEIRIDDDLPLVYVDPNHIVQILNNLVHNAYQAMPDGGWLTISADKGELDIILSVSDTGIGIQPENFNKLFEPLYTTKTCGIGLGLPIAKDLASINNATIDLISEGIPGKGSTFTLRLPLQ